MNNRDYQIISKILKEIEMIESLVSGISIPMSHGRLLLGCEILLLINIKP